ncbi:MAG: ATP-binding protein [Spirochaetia bacterium]|jgi:AAA15 family ATPase/GTPase|nr:ATP-binding protein [Spirochaetia bacterium]
MIEKMSVKNFRGLANVALSFAPFTLIGGANNVGKTSVLEAVFLLYGHRSPLVFQQLRSFRNASAPVAEARELWENIFNDYDLSKYLSISAVRDKNSESLEVYRDDSYDIAGELTQIPQDAKLPTSSLGLSYPLKVLYKYGKKETQFHLAINTDAMGTNIFARGNNNSPAANIGNIPTVTFSSDRLLNTPHLYDLLGKISRNKQKDKAVNVLKDIDGRINDIVLGEKQQIYLDVTGLIEMIPLTFMGTGVSNVLYWTALALSDSAKIILIDEIENGIHYSSMQSVMEKLCDIGERHDCQIIATTHSIDCVRSFSKCSEKRISYIRLERSLETGEVSPVVIDAQLLPEMLESDWEVR